MGAARIATPFTGARSITLLGKQTRFGVPVDDFSNMIMRQFPGVRNNLDVNANFIESESFTGSDTAPPAILGELNPQGQWENEQLPEDIIHFLLWGMNVQANPRNVDITTLEGAVYAIASDAATPTDTTSQDNSGAGWEPDWPSQVRFAFSNSTVVSTGANIRLVGATATGQTGASSKVETIDISGISGTGNVTSINFFRNLSSYRFEGVTAGNVAVSFIPDSQQVTFELGSLDNGLVAYTSQMRKGLELFAGLDVTSDDMSITMGQNVRVAMNLRASRLLKNVLITDLLGSATELPQAQANLQPSSLNFAKPRGTGLYLGEINSSETSIEDVDFTKPVTTSNVVVSVNNNVEEPTGNTAELSAPQPAPGDRQVAIQVEKAAEMGADEPDWDNIFRTGSYIPIVVRNYNVASNGRLYLVEYRFPRCSFSEAPALPIEGRGAINRTLNFNCTGTADASALTVQIISKHGFSNGNGQ